MFDIRVFITDVHVFVFICCSFQRIFSLYFHDNAIQRYIVNCFVLGRKRNSRLEVLIDPNWLVKLLPIHSFVYVPASVNIWLYKDALLLIHC